MVHDDPPQLTLVRRTSLLTLEREGPGPSSHVEKQQQQQERARSNNGVGNGTDPQSPGNPKPNDAAGTAPGNPDNAGGKN